MNPDDDLDVASLRREIDRLRRLLARRTRALRRARAALRSGAGSDPLTGLPMRGRAEAWLLDARACLMTDLDGFKRINDDLGHLAGDAVLRDSARALAAAVPDGGRIARFGGDEFLIVLPSSSADDPRHVAEALRSAIRAVECGPLSLTVGVAIARTGEPPGSLLARADQALVRAKKAGRDRVDVDPG